MRPANCALLCLGLLAIAGAATSADARAARDGDAAHLFGYFPKPGLRAEFEAGYRRHLQWHRDHRDPLPWYGWYVTSGARAGMFIDGSFGAPFAAFDARVDPAGDAADGARNVTAFAAPAFRASYRLRREFSTGFPLERRSPTEEVQVFHYRLVPGASRRFEALLLAARGELEREGDAPAYTWYELVVGGASPGYLLMVARDGWAGYDAHPGGLESVLAAAARTGRGQGLLEAFSASVAAVESETWGHRPDLGSVPPR
jgi:hypothetical protein